MGNVSKVRAFGAGLLLLGFAVSCHEDDDDAPVAGPPVTRLVSVDSSGNQADAPTSAGSAFPAVSSDGRTVAFVTSATNLVPGDTNAAEDVFLRDTVAGTTIRVSVSSAGAQGDAASGPCAISGDGRYVAFESDAGNLVAGDTNGVKDIFLRDTVAGTTLRVSVDSSENEADARSTEPKISSDGRYVVFESTATNLVPGDTNGVADVFLRDTVAGTTLRVSVDSAGNEGDGDAAWPNLSSGGRYVVFGSFATNLVAGDTNGAYDVFRHDTVTGSTIRVSVDSAGVEGNGQSQEPHISDDGRYVVFGSYASNLVAGDANGDHDIFVRDVNAGVTLCVSVNGSGTPGNAASAFGTISADGRYVAFTSSASDLVAGASPGTSDTFVRDLVGGSTVLLSVSVSGGEANDGSDTCFISADGRYVIFSSYASDLVPSDTNGLEDLFIRGPLH